MIFGAPYMLWGLLGLFVPVAIHMLSRKEQKVIKVGSIKLFSEIESVKVRRFMPSDYLLLLLRCLVITTLVIWLAEPKKLISGENVPLAYLIDPGLSEHPFIKEEIAPLQNSYWLQEAITATNEGPGDTSRNVNFWKLAESLTPSLQADSIVFITQPLVRNMGDFRPKIGKPFSWVTLEIDEELPRAIGHFERGDTSFQLISDEWNTWYIANDTTSAKQGMIPTKTIHLAYPDSLEYSMQRFKQMLLVLGDYSGVEVVDTTAEAADFIFWFFNTQPENPSEQLITIEVDSGLEPRIIEGPSGSHVITAIPEGNEMFDSKLAEQLLQVLSLYPDANLQHHDPRHVSNAQIFPRYDPTLATGNDQYKYLHLILLLAGILLIAERIVSNRQQR